MRTDGGREARPVAKPVPLDRPPGQGMPGLAPFRRTMPILEPLLSATLEKDREDRF